MIGIFALGVAGSSRGIRIDGTGKPKAVYIALSLAASRSMLALRAAAFRALRSE